MAYLHLPTASSRLRFQASLTDRGFSNRGFTLIELVISVALGSLTFAALASIVVSHIRTTSTSELAARVRGDANRIEHFIQTEASEAASVGNLAVNANCAAALTGGTTLFNLNVPRDTGSADDLTNVVRIFYYTDVDGNLRRCGPSINPNGSLNYSAASVDGIVSTNTNLILSTSTQPDVSCNGAITDNRQVVYRLELNDVNIAGAGANYETPCQIVRTKSYFVIEPTPPPP